MVFFACLDGIRRQVGLVDRRSFGVYVVAHRTQSGALLFLQSRSCLVGGAAPLLRGRCLPSCWSLFTFSQYCTVLYCTVLYCARAPWVVLVQGKFTPSFSHFHTFRRPVLSELGRQQDLFCYFCFATKFSIHRCKEFQKKGLLSLPVTPLSLSLSLLFHLVSWCTSGQAGPYDRG